MLPYADLLSKEEGNGVPEQGIYGARIEDSSSKNQVWQGSWTR
jgi:hypothetical protein